MNINTINLLNNYPFDIIKLDLLYRPDGQIRLVANIKLNNKKE